MNKSALSNIRSKTISLTTILIGIGIGSIIFLNYKAPDDTGSVLGVDTAGFVMPQIGADTLINPEYYEPAIAPQGSDTQIDTLLVTQTLGEITRTETPDHPVYGFGLLAESKEELSDVSFIVFKNDNTQVGPYKVNLAESLIDKEGDPVTKAFTEPYLFAAGVVKVDFFNTDNKEFDIEYIDFIAQGDEGNLTTQTVTADANALYKTRFMNEADLNIITRDMYGAADDNIFAPSWTPPYYAVNRIVIHHTATGVDMANPSNTVAAIWRYHTYTLDWGDVGYNFMIDPYGNIFEGRAGINGVRGNHAPPNEGSIGISLLGDFTSQLPTQAALNSLTRLIAYLAQVNRIDLIYKTSWDPANPEGLYPHKAINATACPGYTFTPILPQIRDAAAALMELSPKIEGKVQEVNEMIDDEEYFETAATTQIIIKMDGLPDLLKEKLRNPPPRYASKIESHGILTYSIYKDQLEQSLTELQIIAPETIIQPNYRYELQGWTTDNIDQTAEPDDYNLTDHWNLEQINAPEAWYYLHENTDPPSYTGSSDVKIAVIDSGVAYQTWDFNVGSDFDREYFISPDFDPSIFDTEYAYDAGWDLFCELIELQTDTTCTEGELTKLYHPNDENGHGTFVTSIIASRIADSLPNKILGIAPSITILPIRVSFPERYDLQTYWGQLPDPAHPDAYSGFIYTTAVTYGIQRAVYAGADIISMSIGGKSEGDPYLTDAINTAYNAGITIVVSAGNHPNLWNNYENIFYPAYLPNVIAVGASDYAGTASANYSNYGPELDIVAPVGSSTENGVIASSLSCMDDVNDPLVSWDNGCNQTEDLSIFPINGEALESWGTSFATPQVAAQLALLLALKPDIGPANLFSLLSNTSNDIGTEGFDDYTGFGNIDLYESVLVTDSIVLPQITSISPTYGKAKGGNIVNVYGSNFQAGLSVKLNNTTINSSDVTFINSSQVSFKVPAVYSAQIVNITITNPDNYFSIKNNAYTYLDPNLNFSSELWFRSGQYNWSITNTKYFTSGDYNGDGKDEVAAMYDYGNQDMALIVFSGNGTYFEPSTWFRSGQWNWGVANTKYITSGDFDNDGVDEIAAMYDYGNQDMAIIVFNPVGNTFTTSTWFRSGIGNWSIANTKYVTAGDFNNDGKDELSTMYDYGNQDMALIVFSGNGTYFASSTWFRSGIGNWSIANTKYVTAGDFNNDGKDELSTMYDYGNQDMALIVFSGNGTYFASSTWFRSGAYNWGIAYTKYVTAGDFDNDGIDEISAMYDYGNQDMAFIIFKTSDTSFSPITWFRSGIWNWSVTNTKFVTPGDFNNDGFYELTTVYDYGYQDMALIIFK